MGDICAQTHVYGVLRQKMRERKRAKAGDITDVFFG